MEQAAKAFVGELDVEDGAFECIVDRLVQHRPPTAAEVRESQRRADEAARIIEASTPEI